MKRTFRQVPMTPSYERIRQRFQSFMIGDESADVGHLVLALLCEESLGGKCLADLGVSIAGIADGCFGSRAADTAMLLIEEGNDAVPNVLPIEAGVEGDRRFAKAEWFQSVHERAGFIARRSHVAAELSTEHLVQAMVEVAGPAKLQLREAGVDTDVLLAELLDERDIPAPLDVDFQLTTESGSEPITFSRDTAESRHSISKDDYESDVRVFALLDANLNRCREGIRVLEDYARFVRRDPTVTESLKELRHDLVTAELAFRSQYPHLLKVRDTRADVGTSITTVNEMSRGQISDVVTANARRVQESLRSLEEFGKLVCIEFSSQIKQLRYQAYELERKLTGISHVTADLGTSPLRAARLERLAVSRLYVLISESDCRGAWQETVSAALNGGADVIQLREKSLPEEELISRSRWMADACEAHGALFILNDRADLAQACAAHGVHLGQDDIGIDEARLLLSPDQLIGVSTHDVGQVRLAGEQGADYLGVGPVFASGTKTFTDFPGLPFVAEAAAHAVRPWFAIGGINSTNIGIVLQHGATRVAVCGAVAGDSDPQSRALALRTRIIDPDHCGTVRFPRS